MLNRFKHWMTNPGHAFHMSCSCFYSDRRYLKLRSPPSRRQIRGDPKPTVTVWVDKIKEIKNFHMLLFFLSFFFFTSNFTLIQISSVTWSQLCSERYKEVGQLFLWGSHCAVLTVVNVGLYTVYLNKVGIQCKNQHCCFCQLQNVSRRPKSYIAAALQHTELWVCAKRCFSSCKVEYSKAFKANEMAGCVVSSSKSNGMCGWRIITRVEELFGIGRVFTYKQ